MRFYVAPSTIRGAGGGLFVAAPLRAGECLERYEGERVPAARAYHPNYVRGYLMHQGSALVDGRDPAGRLVLEDGTTVDVHGWTDATWRRNLGQRRGVAWRGAANLMRFVNSADGAHPANCVLTRKCGGVGFKAKRPIAVGEELLAHYGGSYWKSHNDDTCAKCVRRGLLVECDGCTRSYHLECAGFRSAKDLPTGEWRCVHCR